MLNVDKRYVAIAIVVLLMIVLLNKTPKQEKQNIEITDDMIADFIEKNPGYELPQKEPENGTTKALNQISLIGETISPRSPATGWMIFIIMIIVIYYGVRFSFTYLRDRLEYKR